MGALTSSSDVINLIAFTGQRKIYADTHEHKGNFHLIAHTKKRSLLPKRYPCD